MGPKRVFGLRVLGFFGSPKPFSFYLAFWQPRPFRFSTFFWLPQASRRFRFTGFFGFPNAFFLSFLLLWPPSFSWPAGLRRSGFGLLGSRRLDRMVHKPRDTLLQPFSSFSSYHFLHRRRQDHHLLQVVFSTTNFLHVGYYLKFRGGPRGMFLVLPPFFYSPCRKGTEEPGGLDH